MWILAAPEYDIKWIQTVALRRANGAAIVNFIRGNVICRFGITKHILSENGIPFVNDHVQQLLEEYIVDQVKSSPYYLQGNLQAEATNKTLLEILCRMVEEPKCGQMSSLSYCGLIEPLSAPILNSHIYPYYIGPRQRFPSR